jgi:hypothetical protein
MNNSLECLSILRCLHNPLLSGCENLCEDDECMSKVEHICPDVIYFPNVPILFGNDQPFLNNLTCVK